jgi:hypothetical protein
MNLTHFTRSSEAVSNILSHGFAWMRNDRKVIRDLLPEVDFSKREPQSFGQISFTENSRETSPEHIKKHGTFGIEVRWEWAKRNKIQPVIYIPQNGPMIDALKYLYTQTYKKAKAEELYPNDKDRQMWETNAAMAGVAGAPLYGKLLKLYEYMEPAENSHEREWRIANQEPYYSIATDLNKIIEDVSPPKGWQNIMNVVKIEPGDIINISCKKGNYSELTKKIPEKFRHVHIQIA